MGARRVLGAFMEAESRGGAAAGGEPRPGAESAGSCRRAKGPAPQSPQVPRGPGGAVVPVPQRGPHSSGSRAPSFCRINN